MTKIVLTKINFIKIKMTITKKFRKYYKSNYGIKKITRKRRKNTNKIKKKKKT